MLFRSVSQSRYGVLMNDLKNTNYKIVNNVVDENFYSDSSKIHFPKIQILHVSCFDNQSKNITGMLRALKELTNQRFDFEVDIVGSGHDFEMAVELFHKLNFPKNTIRFCSLLFLLCPLLLHLYLCLPLQVFHFVLLVYFLIL